MLNKKKNIIFVTGTRADYGKLKSIIFKIQTSNKFRSFVFVTGMHNLKKYGNTWAEIKKDKVKNIFRFNNQIKDKKMDNILGNTIKGFSKFALRINPDLIVIHGDRIEPLACAIVGCLNNFKVAHIEGGDISGNVDEILRHSISKLSHLHFVSNFSAKKRLIQMGESKKNIFIIGSPDIDILLSKKLPSIDKVKDRYNIKFKNYSICIFHSVTTELNRIEKQTNILIDSLKVSNLNYVIILPNNDTGSEAILKIYGKIKNKSQFKILPSMRFEHYLTLLKNSDFIIGNSSSAIIEAPYYNVPTINLGSRQKNRTRNFENIINLNFNKKTITEEIKLIISNKNKKKIKRKKFEFGQGKSALNFFKILNNQKLWKKNNQKQFIDFKYS